MISRDGNDLLSWYESPCRLFVGIADTRVASTRIAQPTSFFRLTSSFIFVVRI